MAELDEDLYRPLAKQLLTHAINYHHRHHLNHQDKTISVGLIRMANINPLMQTALALHQADTIPTDTHIHLAVYHSQQILLLRNQLETQLDTILNRKNRQQPTDNASIQHTIAAHPNATHHLFIVLASPVCEVGRDHDYDWAIVEPSSIRSLIQLAGRINRHRPDRLPESPNIGIWQHNIRALKGKHHCLQNPGYESATHPLTNHDLKQLIPAEQLARIDAQPRIIKPNNLAPRERLADLEHQALAELMNNSDINIINAYWQDNTFNRQHTHLIRLSPFRQSETENDYIIRPENGDNIPYHREQIDANGGFHGAKSAADHIQPYTFNPNPNAPITPWLNTNLAEQIDNIADKFRLDSKTNAQKNMDDMTKLFSVITLPKRDNKPWHFHEAFGCWQDDA
ncbi:hypothetical protein [Suttonella ornithocola]|uniref:CRISPR-associated helicase Cas3, subtype I-F/YPEST n=1 Tax=Suttonella ornithocola TaxID=279832 RepID=A0A380MT08_9GAMM|nr:hypothetical protein [Suttonella ornithocola]SUO95053.1 CRISPR-associated helicase Cas3, subtype I-F/YPEST [Suttonella ornithocola]